MRVYTHAIYGQSPSPPTTPAALPRQAQEASCYGALPYLYPAGFPGRPIAAGHTSLLCCILFESLVVVFICFLAIFIGGCFICCICWPLSCFLGAVLKIKTSGTSLTLYIYRRIPFVCLFVCPWRRLTPTNPRRRLGYIYMVLLILHHVQRRMIRRAFTLPSALQAVYSRERSTLACAVKV